MNPDLLQPHRVPAGQGCTPGGGSWQPKKRPGARPGQMTVSLPMPPLSLLRRIDYPGSTAQREHGSTGISSLNHPLDVVVDSTRVMNAKSVT